MHLGKGHSNSNRNSSNIPHDAARNGTGAYSEGGLWHHLGPTRNECFFATAKTTVDDKNPA